VNTPWREVEPLPTLNGAVSPVLLTVDSLRTAWERSIAQAPPAEFSEARQRSLRRHAIETGIIERLYDLDWGVTEALVAEGITAEVAAREGGVSDEAFELMRDQLDALEYLSEAVRDGRDLSVFFVRELHQLITRHQTTYEARDALGRLVQVPLPQGEWKTQANHVRRPDGTLLEYTPPEHVPGQMERLVELYRETEGAHPVVRAAWLHHRFICVHPFADGNGRVARALTLLVLLRERYAPLVVDRRNRPDYIAALDAANDGDLRPLVHLFAQLEIVSLRAELERPALTTPATSSAATIARAHADRVLQRERVADAGTAAGAAKLGDELRGRTKQRIRQIAGEVREAFVELDPQAWQITDGFDPASPALLAQRLRVRDNWLFYYVYVDPVGDEGAVAVEVSAEARGREGDDVAKGMLSDLPPNAREIIVAPDTMEARWPEVEELLDRTFALAVDRFSRRLY
jgi:Fic family protein